MEFSLSQLGVAPSWPTQLSYHAIKGCRNGGTGPQLARHTCDDCDLLLTSSKLQTLYLTVKFAGGYGFFEGPLPFCLVQQL